MSFMRKKRKYLQIMNDDYFKEIGYKKVQSKFNK